MVDEPTRKPLSREPVEQLAEFFVFFFLQDPPLLRELVQHFRRSMNRVSGAEVILEREKAPWTATVFGRTGTGTAETDRIPLFRIDRQHFFQSDFVFPVITKVVGVQKALVRAKLKLMEIHVGRVIGKDHPPAMIDAIVLAVDEEGMEMGIGLAHDELQNIMEIDDGTVTADQNASPNRGANATQPNAKLVNGWRCLLTAHWLAA